MFRTFSSRGIQHVWRGKHDKYHHMCINRAVKKPLGVIVWGASSSKCLTTAALMNSKIYQETIINDLKMQRECLIFPSKEYIFQQDNAPWHALLSTKTFLQAQGILTFALPSNSPDISPIERVWTIIKRRMTSVPKRKEALWKKCSGYLVQHHF